MNIDIESIEEAANALGVDLDDFGKDEDEMHELYDQMLDEVATCDTCGRGGSDLKDEDPTAYRCGFNDWIDSERDTYIYIGSKWYDEDDISEVKDALKDAIDNL